MAKQYKTSKNALLPNNFTDYPFPTGFLGFLSTFCLSIYLSTFTIVSVYQNAMSFQQIYRLHFKTNIVSHESDFLPTLMNTNKTLL